MRFLLLGWATAALSAQSFEFQRSPVKLEGMWRCHEGDDPRWADPSFDDSGWPVVKMPATTLGAHAMLRWYRFRIGLASSEATEPLALLVGLFGNAAAVEVFAQGRRVGRQGDPGAGVPGLLTARPLLATLGPVQGKELIIAIRVNESIAPHQIPLSPARSISWIGTSEDITRIHGLWQGQLLRSQLPFLLMTMALVGVALFFLAVGFWQAGMRECAWLGGLLAMNWCIDLLAYFPGWTLWPALWTNAAITLFVAATLTVWGALCIDLFEARWSGWIVIATVLASSCYAGPLGLFAANIPYVAWYVPLLLSVPLFMMAVYFDAAWRQARRRRVMTSLDAAVIAHALAVLAGYLWQFSGGVKDTIPDEVFIQAAFGREVTLSIFAAVMLGLLNRRSSRLRDERARLKQEMEAGAEMQVMLLARTVDVPGLQVDAVYWPASEVGGDFFYTLKDGDALVVLVGDVSGKGLRAAMLVSTVAGILRQTAERRPGPLLAEFNRALTGQTRGGFVTCCAARITPAGGFVLASAGHPAPYVDAEEAILETGLPLGLSPGETYAERALTGASAVFISDGVLEAENAARELFGFARTQSLAARPAAEIAGAAKQWGQTDDITVVTVRRSA